MTWVRVDDRFPLHPKSIAAGPLGRDLWLCGNCYCNAYLTDGFIPKSALKSIAPGHTRPEKTAEVLVASGLWEAVEGGYRVHDYHDYQLASDVVRERIERLQRAKSAGGKARAALADRENGRYRPAERPAADQQPALESAGAPAGPAGPSAPQQPPAADQQPALAPAGVLVPAAHQQPAPSSHPIPSHPSLRSRSHQQPGGGNGASRGPAGGGSAARAPVNGTGKALKDLLTPEDTVRLRRLGADLEKQVGRDKDRFDLWQCLQRMVNGGLPVAIGKQILLRLRDAGVTEPIRCRWAWVQTVCDREHADLHIRVALEEHARLKTAKPNMQALGSILQGIAKGAESSDAFS